MEEDVAGTYRVPVAERDHVRAGLAVQLVAMCFGVSADEISGCGRLGRKGCHARRVALYLAHVSYGWPLEQVGHAFGVSRATAGFSCRWAEDARDDPALDGMLDRLTEMIRGVCDSPTLNLDESPAR
jgi:hypothetical protein